MKSNEEEITLKIDFLLLLVDKNRIFIYYASQFIKMVYF